MHCNPSTGTAFQRLCMGLRCPLDENRGNCRPAGKDEAASNSLTFRHSQRKMLYLGTDMKPRLLTAVIPTDTCEFFVWNTACSCSAVYIFKRAALQAHWAELCKCRETRGSSNLNGYLGLF